MSLLGLYRPGTTWQRVGTQMLTKGHHFPDLATVGIVDGVDAPPRAAKP